MYEMEGPRLCPGALATRLLRGRTPRSYHQCQILAVSTGRPALPASPPVSLGLEPVFCGEEFLLPTAPAAQGLSAISSRFFCRPQDICRLSPVHSSFPLAYAQVCPQSVWTARRVVTPSSAQRIPAARSEARQRLAGEAGNLSYQPTEGQTMSPDSQSADQAAARDRNRARIRTVTAVAGLTSVLAAGAVAYTLPGSTHAATASAQSSSSTSSAAARSSSSGSTSSTSNTGKSNSSASGSGLKSTSAPAASSGTSAVTSGGS